MKIELLDKTTIDQIAAGEVVERPASVIKELIENALDAGATVITVECRNGGKTLLRVTDNGCGIEGGQIEKAFLRHATSKIRTIGDLDDVRSLGFRGEALSSISSVSRMECITKTTGALTGTRLVLEGGCVIAREEVGAPDGTTMVVRDLFYNTPAREKFLRSGSAEGRSVREITEQLALSHPDTAFTFLSDGRTLFVTSGNGNVAEIVHQIYGRDLAKHLIETDGSGEGCRVHGFLGPAEHARGNRTWERFYVNGRPVVSDLLSRAAEEGYHGFLMQHRYPFLILYLETDPGLVDVNVHPAKREVRFSYPAAVAELIAKTVSRSLLATKHIPGGEKEPRDKAVAAPAEQVRRPEPFERARIESMTRTPEGEQLSFLKEPSPAGYDSKYKGEKPPAKEIEPEPLLCREARVHHRLIGQVFGTYWMIEYEDKLYLIDQHAAHEKVLFERMMKAHAEKNITSQQVFPAVVIEVGAADAQIIAARMEAFQSLGFEIEPFGGNAFKISAVPANLYGIDVHTLFVDLLDQIRILSPLATDAVEEKIASLSCKAAVKGNTTLSVREAESLIDELLTLENPYHCPHGRPTIVTMSRQELDRKFKRIV